LEPAAGNAATNRVRIGDLRAGERIDDAIVLIAQKDLRTGQNGGLYIHAVFADASGQLVARMWNASQEIYESIPESGLLHVKGRVESYKGKLQFIIDGVRGVDPGEAALSDFLPRTRYDVEKMWARVLEIERTVRNPELLALLARFINDAEFVRRYKSAPAARTNHHAFIGGLLEHTLSLLELALLVLPRYPEVNRDLVLAGLFLHDAGKTSELSFEAGFSYTNEGQLLGHIVQVMMWLAVRAREVESQSGKPFPQPLLYALGHIVVSHHGKYEFGSPKLPSTPEAILVHHLDNLDAKLNMAFTAIAADPDTSSEWTAWVPALETKIFKPDVTRRESVE
jgi:3'-5' exoribonuclease